jgi:hypothetical protein
MASTLLPPLLALLLASVTVLYDCHVSIQDRLKRVPMPIYASPQALAFALACGIVAVVAFEFTDGSGNTLMDSTLGLKQTNSYLRGLSVGLTVLVLIRSKLSSIKGAEVGGELFYNEGRLWVMASHNSRWRRFKANFNQRNLTKALATQDYENRLFMELREAIKIQPEDFRLFVEGQIKNVQESKPKSAFNASVIDWQNYYRTITNLALDYAGPPVFEGWAEFK